jgi:methylmalonyl-CoA/ethylmalonyl-CoA epimerase
MSATTAGSEITAVRQIAITVSDVGRALEFYRDALGLTFLFSAGPNLAFLDIGGVRLMLSAPEPGFAPGASSVLYFKVADIMAAHADLSARGVPFPSEPHFLAPMPDHDLWLSEFRDPDGNPLALMCERTIDPTRRTPSQSQSR